MSRQTASVSEQLPKYNFFHISGSWIFWNPEVVELEIHLPFSGREASYIYHIRIIMPDLENPMQAFPATCRAAVVGLPYTRVP
jgi:hypothetical protein